MLGEDGIISNNISLYQYEAIDWLANYDPLQLPLTHSTEYSWRYLVERYALVAMYYAADTTYFVTNWLGNTSHCNWHGITCDNHQNVNTFIFGKTVSWFVL